MAHTQTAKRHTPDTGICTHGTSHNHSCATDMLQLSKTHPAIRLLVLGSCPTSHVMISVLDTCPMYMREFLSIPSSNIPSTYYLISKSVASNHDPKTSLNLSNHVETKAEIGYEQLPR